MSEFPVEIIRSDRRKRTLQASVVDGTIRVRVPAGLPHEEERRLVSELVGKIRRKLEAGAVDLPSRASNLARRYQLPEPTEIAWSDRQNLRWGSCTPDHGTIRISNRLATVPAFVLDYVLVHELAHLEVAGHGADFKALENRYELAERARGYLMALGRTSAG
jgi:predicted metal-dependent hydrolase